MRKSLLLALLAGALASASALTPAAGFAVPDLMQLLSQKKADNATFVEKKYIAILDKPVESSGELSFTAPDKLEKRTLKPKPEALLLEGNQLTLERSDGRKLRVKLSDRPEAAAFVESIRATLAGDRSALERYYNVTLTGAADNWRLALTPVQPRMLKVISQIRIAGSRDKVRTIEFEQADGDRSEMTITSTGAK